jgi:hypothetical protein
MRILVWETAEPKEGAVLMCRTKTQTRMRGVRDKARSSESLMVPVRVLTPDHLLFNVFNMRVNRIGSSLGVVS